jgi:DNA-binding transcriptional ArsR family regulator
MGQMELADADLATIGAAIGDPTRARFVLSLLGGVPLAASELAARAGTSPSLTSSHLSKLLAAGLVTADKHGRQRLYSLASPEVAHSIEGLLAIAPHRAVNGLSDHIAGQALQRARTCYDHFAGRLGVGLADAFERDGVLLPTENGWELTDRGRDRLGELGIDAESIGGRRQLLRPCLDWTERRNHLAGSLGATIADRFFRLGWVKRTRDSRSITVTTLGKEQLLSQFAIDA